MYIYILPNYICIKNLGQNADIPIQVLSMKTMIIVQLFYIKLINF